ncbi:uncharacterized protein LOC124264548 [Haliotis rubra]|uniref:uncharacterized protein LOC124264548 n=1 Tax=Haliotis rubra TaxID=36100 RepID=UPI001EE6209C|nr:uncharacterized protein LOC124264548 [Haliotis rubra]XP_046555252.1 uncharacterized protein LOC124264548 [Haliotis rubra]XP_046555253.1 uncharacterized protein LOC124264548 [Haliotis rubra]
MERGQLSCWGMKKAILSTSRLLLILLTCLFLNLFPLVGFFTDPNNPDLCFINWKNLLLTGLFFLKLVFTLLKSRVRMTLLRHGRWRVFLCGVFIVVSSYFFVAVVLDRSALWTWETFKSNYIKRLEDSVIAIDETRPEFMVREREIPGPEPLKLERHLRYEGEDVRLICKDLLVFHGIVKFHEKQVIWKLNGQRIDSSPRHRRHITTVFEKNDLNRSTQRLSTTDDRNEYLVTSKLEINLIDTEDFGKYSCHVAKMATLVASYVSNNKKKTDAGEPSQDEGYSRGKTSHECPNVRKEHTKCPCPHKDLPHLNVPPLPYTWTAEFIVEKIKAKRKRVSVPIGGIVSTSASYSYIDGPNQIDFDHEINGQSFVNICEGFDQSCSIFVFLYWFLWHDGGHYSSIPAFKNKLLMVDGVGGTSWQCACPNTYGVHKFVFYREMYDTSLGRNQIIEVEYPDTIELVPEKPQLLDLYYNSSKEILPLGEPPCWGNVQTTTCDLLEMLLENISYNFLYREKLIFYGGLTFCIILAWFFTRVILKRVTNPCINMILGRRRVNIQPIQGRGTLAGLAPSDNTTVKYDLYISYADEQKAMASEIAKALISRGLRVCFRDNDVLGHEIVTQAVSRLIMESWKYLVIVSQEYVDSGLQNKFEIHLITQRHRDGYINNQNVAILALNTDLIQDVFSSYVILRHYENSDDDLDDILLWHGQSIFPNDSNTSVRIERQRLFGRNFDCLLPFIQTCFWVLSFWVLYLFLVSGCRL